MSLRNLDGYALLKQQQIELQNKIDRLSMEGRFAEAIKAVVALQKVDHRLGEFKK